MAQQARLSVTVRDEWGIEAATTAYISVDDAATMANLQTAWFHFQQDIDAVSDGQVVRGSIALVMAPDSVKTAPNAGSRVEQTGLFNFIGTASPRRWAAAVPAIAAAVLSGDRIDLANGDVATFVALLTGGVSGTYAYTNDHNQPITALADAFSSFRRKRKQLQRSSFEVA